MITRVLLVSIVSMFLSWHQQVGAQPDPPPGARGPKAAAAASLSDEQVARVKAVLAPYVASRLTVDDAKSIKRALRDAGMRPSRELEAALRAQGFSPERLDELDPRPPGPPGAGEAGSRQPERNSRSPSPSGSPSR